MWSRILFQAIVLLFIFCLVNLFIGREIKFPTTYVFSPMSVFNLIDSGAPLFGEYVLMNVMSSWSFYNDHYIMSTCLVTSFSLKSILSKYGYPCLSLLLELFSIQYVFILGMYMYLLAAEGWILFPNPTRYSISFCWWVQSTDV